MGRLTLPPDSNWEILGKASRTTVFALCKKCGREYEVRRDNIMCGASKSCKGCRIPACKQPAIPKLTKKTALWMLRNGYSKAEAARALGISPTVMSNWGR